MVAAACTSGGGGGGGGESGGKAATLIVAEPSDNPGDIKARETLAAQFMKLHPNIPVKILVIPADGYDEKVLSMIAGGTPPDLFVSGDVQIPNIVAKHYAMNLMDFVNKDHYDLSVLYPQIIQGLTYQGQLVGLTDNWDTQVMYYNKTLFDQAHVAYPNENWTWDDMVAAASKLTSGSGTTETYGVVYDPWFAPVYSTIWSWGGDIVDATGTQCQLDQPPAIDALTHILDLYKAGISPSPQQMSQQGQGSEQIFLSGRAAMLIGNGRWAAFDMTSVQRFEWDMAPLPKGPSGRSNFFHLSMFGITATSKNTQNAWEFLKYMLSPEGIAVTVGNAQGLPSRPDMLNDPAFANSPLVKEHDTVQPMLVSLPTAHVAPNIVGFNQFQDQLDAAWDPMFTMKQTPQAAMTAFCQKADSGVLSEGSVAGG
jgi:multiple sugar transport system substrate-binding protein